MPVCQRDVQVMKVLRPACPSPGACDFLLYGQMRTLPHAGCICRAAVGVNKSGCQVVQALAAKCWGPAIRCQLHQAYSAWRSLQLH